MRSYLLDKEAGAVASVFTVNGFNFAGRGQSSGLAFIMLKPWDERDADNSVFTLAAACPAALLQLPRRDGVRLRSAGGTGIG